MAVVNMRRARVTHPSGTFFPVRFVFHDKKAAIWKEDRRTNTATRLAYTPDASLVRPTSARHPWTLTDHIDDSTWTIKQEQGGACCGSVFRSLPISTLLDPEIDTV